MVLKLILHLSLIVAVCQTLEMTQNCMFNNEKRTYLCTGITKQFPNMYYSNYHIKCADCNIKTFTIETFPWDSKLVSFNVSESGIESIYGKAFLKLSGLQYLYLQNNKINSIYSEAFSGLRQIYELHLEYNQLTSLRAGMFKNMEGVAVIINHNKLLEIPPNIFEGNYGILSLNFSHNRIGVLHRDSFNHLNGLEVLDLSYNKICYFPLRTFSYLTNLRDLFLKKNSIRSFPIGMFSGLQNLLNLDLSYNQFKQFDPIVLLSFGRISQLDLSGNALTFIDSSEIHSNAPTIRNIAITDNIWTCTTLANIVQYFKRVNVDVSARYGGKFDVTNINGVACSVEDVSGIDNFDRFLYIVETYTNQSLVYC